MDIKNPVGRCFSFASLFLSSALGEMLYFFTDLREALIPYVPTGTLQIPSNVTRISRALRRHGLDGTPQIIYYHSGVGTGSSLVDTITGGLLGTGISEVTVNTM